MDISLKPRHARGFLLLCVSASTEPAARPLRWSNGHGDRSGAVGVMTSPVPLLPEAGRGAFSLARGPQKSPDVAGLQLPLRKPNPS